MLGYHLLWVDCLYIVQDDLIEWKKESVKMASVYKHAVVTIVADHSEDSMSGMFNSESVSIMDWTPHVRLTNKLADGRRSTLYFAPSTYLYVEPDFNFSPPSARGWCSQERASSSRTLHFGSTQLFWQCMHTAFTEDNIARKMTLPRISDMIF